MAWLMILMQLDSTEQKKSGEQEKRTRQTHTRFGSLPINKYTKSSGKSRKMVDNMEFN